MSSPTTNQKRYECRWRDTAGSTRGAQSHYWVDHNPNEPHWPDSAVMRWDLRQQDWDRIWPELIDHPCAILFAPRHPNRNGAPRFKDWVESWPKKFDWKTELPEHLHPAILKALVELSSSATNVLSEESQPGPPEPTTTPSKGLEPEELLEQLSAALLDIDDKRRQIISQHLATLAMAPDSGRVIQALKLAFKK